MIGQFVTAFLQTPLLCWVYCGAVWLDSCHTESLHWTLTNKAGFLNWKRYLVWLKSVLPSQHRHVSLIGSGQWVSWTFSIVRTEFLCNFVNVTHLGWAITCVSQCSSGVLPSLCTLCCSHLNNKREKCVRVDGHVNVQMDITVLHCCSLKDSQVVQTKEFFWLILSTVSYYIK